MTFPLYFVYMVEATGLGEIGRNKVEINRNNILKTIVFNEINKIGSRYYQKNPRKERNFGDWEVKNNRDTEKRELDISKEKGKQHLKINFEQKEMTGFDFTLSDGETIVSLHKNNEGKLVVSRKDKADKLINKSQDLTLREYLELRNFPFKFAIDRNVNAIVVPAGYVASVALVVGVAAGAAKTDSKTIPSLSDAFFNRPALSRSGGISRETILSEYSSIPNIKQDFANLESKDLEKYNIDGDETTNPGLVTDLKLVEEFFSPKFAKKDGISQMQAIEKFLMESGIPSGELFRYRGRETNDLPQSLKEALQRLEADKFPYSPDTIYGFVSALREFNSGQKIATPEKILRQANAVDNNLSNAYYNLDYYVDSEGKQQPTFNKGPIKGSEFFASILPGDLLVTTNEQYGVIKSVKKDKQGVIISAKIWIYNEQTGKFNVKNISAQDFILSFYYGN